MSWTPGEVSATSVRIGLRRLVMNCSPMRGNSLLTDVRVCDADRYSPGSAAAKANRSPTCPPSTSTMRRCSPCRTHTARPAPAGTTMWGGLFLNSTTPIQLAVTTATSEGLPGVGVDTIYHPGRGAPTCDRRRPLIDSDECPRRCQIASAAASFMDIGTPPAVLTKNPVNGRWCNSARTLSSGCHVTELLECTCTSAQNFGRTFRRGSDGFRKMTRVCDKTRMTSRETTYIAAGQTIAI